MIDFANLRNRMVDTQIARRGVRDKRVLEAMRQVPRECFVSESLEEYAYDDSALPIEQEQTISQPYIVGLMAEAAEVEAGDRVLEVGAGSGYAAAVLGRIAGWVIAIERHEPLVRLARKRLAMLGYDNVEIRTGDGTIGLPEEAPFDAIIVSAASPGVPDALKRQLVIGGCLVIPVGEAREQILFKIKRIGEDQFETEDLGTVMFVPLIGAQGWH